MSTRASVITLALLGGGVLVGLGVWSARSGPSEIVDASAPVSKVAGDSPPVAQLTAAAAASDSAPPDAITRWVADANGGDAARRATAIAALGHAPKPQALPVLRRVLLNGEPNVDRPLALRSLRDLALEQGDADGAIRAAVREAIYHSDDLTNKDDVQDVLDTIEESELR